MPVRVGRFVYPPFASAATPVRITDLAGRKGWGTHSVVSERKRQGTSWFPILNPKS
jgi:hypothetical protein